MIKKIKYHHNYGQRADKPDKMDKAFLLCGEQIPQKVHELFKTLKISELGGSYSSDLPAEPTEVDYLKIETTGKPIEIKVKNRGLNLLMGNNEKLRIVHEFIEKTLHELSEKK